MGRQIATGHKVREGEGFEELDEKKGPKKYVNECHKDVREHDDGEKASKGFHL